MPHTLVFDIGKTNKKCFLFDENYQLVFEKYNRFNETNDKGGFACDNLKEIKRWIKKSIRDILDFGKYNIKAINFSAYGASLVHLDHNGKTLTPLYNYLKPLPKEIHDSFYKKYGDKKKFAKETASPPLGMLNSGLQLYWLKYAFPRVFKKIRWSLHLPQFASYLVTGKAVSEFTSIGCHTGLWDFKNQDYHHWVYAEGIDRILPRIVKSTTRYKIKLKGKKIHIGVGIHDSSAALLAYIQANTKPFILLSTGTWNISLNPFNHNLLTDTDLKHDCLNFMSIEGKPVKASRLFLGNEYKIQIDRLQKEFKKDPTAHTQVTFNEKVYQELSKNFTPHFIFESIDMKREQPEHSNHHKFSSFQKAYHQLMLELVELQIHSINRAIGNTPISTIYIDGGFAKNDLFIQLLKIKLNDKKLRLTQSPIGSAIGAAIVVSDRPTHSKFLKQRYAMKRISPRIS